MILVSYKDYRLAAKKRLPSPIFQYIDGAADGEWSSGNNTASFNNYTLAPSYLNDVSEIKMKTTILGRNLKAPIILSPTGMNRLFHHNKELAVAKTAEKLGIGYALSTLGTTSIEDIAASNSGLNIFQIYIHKDRSLTHEFVDRCKAANYDALCLTVDTAAAGNRERDIKSGFTMPPRLTFSSLASFALHPHWGLNFLRSPDFGLANISSEESKSRNLGPMGLINYVNNQFDRSVTWQDAEQLINRWGGPFIIKGIQTATDALKAKNAGATAIMISNHGGRQLDATPAPIDCVRSIRDAVGDEMEIIVDGGVRRGTHAIKALALGANAISFGRPYLFALAARGQEGVENYLNGFINEIERDLALLGCTDIASLGKKYLIDQ